MYYAINYTTHSYHSQDGHLCELKANNIEDAIRIASGIIKNMDINRIATERINIVADDKPFDGHFYVYPGCPMDHENWHGKIVKTFYLTFHPYMGVGGYFSCDGIENLDNWK